MSEKETAGRVLSLEVQVLLAFQIFKIFNNIFPEFVNLHHLVSDWLFDE